MPRQATIQRWRWRHVRAVRQSLARCRQAGNRRPGRHTGGSMRGNRQARYECQRRCGVAVGKPEITAREESLYSTTERAWQVTRYVRRQLSAHRDNGSLFRWNMFSHGQKSARRCRVKGARGYCFNPAIWTVNEDLTARGWRIQRSAYPLQARRRHAPRYGSC